MGVKKILSNSQNVLEFSCYEGIVVVEATWCGPVMVMPATGRVCDAQNCCAGPEGRPISCS